MHMIYLKDIIMILILLIVSITDFARKDIDFIPLIIGFIFIIVFNAMGYNDITFKQGIIGFIIFYVLFRIMPRMGQGDARLFGLIGLFYGGNIAFITMYIFFVLVGVVAILLLITRIKKRKDYIALGPFIAISLIIVLIYFPQFSLNLVWL